MTTSRGLGRMDTHLDSCILLTNHSGIFSNTSLLLRKDGDEDDHDDRKNELLPRLFRIDKRRLFVHSASLIWWRMPCRSKLPDLTEVFQVFRPILYSKRQVIMDEHYVGLLVRLLR